MPVLKSGFYFWLTPQLQGVLTIFCQSSLLVSLSEIAKNLGETKQQYCLQYYFALVTKYCLGTEEKNIFS